MDIQTFIRKNQERKRIENLRRQNVLSTVAGKSLLDERLFFISDQRLKFATKECAIDRLNNRSGRGGVSANGEMVAVSKIPAEIYWQLCQTIDTLEDPQERDYAREYLLRTSLQKFKTRD